MNSFFNQLIFKVQDFSRRYPNKQQYAALRLARWCFLQSCKLSFSKQHNEEKNSNWYVIYDKWGHRKKNPRNLTKAIPFLKAGWHIKFDISKALKIFPKTKRIGLVFFMGIGDYFYSTNFIKILATTYPQIKLDAYVSNHFDSNNSPLVAKCLKNNPYIDRVILYSGTNTRPELWKNYNWQECYSLASEDTLLLPVIYEHEHYVLSRTDTLCDTFGLSTPVINPKPLIWDYPPSEKVVNLLNKYKNVMKRVVFLQCSNRSSSFCYPHHDELVKKLLDRGFFVITVEKTQIKSPYLLALDIKKMEITESISLIQEINKWNIPLYMITTGSCFNSISSALDVPVLTMQCFYDVCMSSVIFSNIFLITPQHYAQVLSDRQFIVPKGDFQVVNNRYLYNPSFVIDCFDEMLRRSEKTISL